MLENPLGATVTFNIFNLSSARSLFSEVCLDVKNEKTIDYCVGFFH